MRKATLIFGLFIGLTSLLSCSNSAEKTENKRLQIVCTTGMIADVIQHFLPADVDVVALMGPGVDPHLYKPGFKDLTLVENADIIIYNGLHLEGKMSAIFGGIKAPKKVYSVEQFQEENDWIKLQENPVVYDPHIWFNPSKFIEALDEMAKDIIKSNPGLVYPKEKVAVYLSRFETLKETWLKTVQNIPDNQRVLVTAHDAFSYFGKYFGIEVNALQGINTTAEFGMRDVKQLAQFIISKNVPTIFMESSISPRSIEAVQREVENQGQKLNLGATLYSDAMGPVGSGAENYL
ncbi:MAG: manganese/zinc/iron transport system substrate-binding protein, partial [Luteibaculaceae bacterium]